MKYRYFEKFKFLPDCFDIFIINVPSEKVEETIAMVEQKRMSNVEIHTSYECLLKS